MQFAVFLNVLFLLLGASWRQNFICRRFGTLSVPSSWKELTVFRNVGMKIQLTCSEMFGMRMDLAVFRNVGMNMELTVFLNVSVDVEYGSETST